MLVLTAGVSFAQSTGGGSGNLIRGGGGQVQVNPDGSVDVTNPVNQSMLLNRALGWRCLAVQPPASPPGQARVYNDCATQLLRISTNGGAYVTLGGTGAAGSGTVTSIGISDLAPLFTVSPSAITTTGTFTFALNSQAASTFFASPAGTTGTPVFRGIVASDVPALDVSKITTGVFGNARGGTGLSSYIFGDTLFANGAGALSTLAGNTSSTKKFLSQTGNGTFSGVPAWNVLANTDLPSVNLATANVNGGIAGVLGTANGGTGLSTIGNANTLLGVNNIGNGYEFKTPIAGNNLSITHTAGGIRFDVNSIVATSTLAPDGSVTAPAISFQNETNSGFYRAANHNLRFAVNGLDVLGIEPTVISTPNGFAANSIVSNDGSGINALNASNITTGTISDARTTATTANTFNTIIKRDTFSGGFRAGNISATFFGNGANITNVNATAISGQSLTNLDARYQSPLGFTPENSANKGIANGYASLNGSGVVPTAQLPALNYLPLAGGTLTGALTVSGGGSASSLSIAFNGTYPNTGFYVPSGSADGVNFAYNGSVHSAFNSLGLILNTGKYFGDGSSLSSVNAARLGGQTLANLDTRYQAPLSFTPENSANKGAVNGYASLNGSGIVPTAQLPALNYLPLTGGTLSGVVEINAPTNPYQLRLRGNGSAPQGLQFFTDSPAIRSWNINADFQSNGDFAITQSTEQNGNPYAGTTRFYINPAGDVSIGNTAPAAKLDVTGIIRGTQFTSTTATGTAPFSIASTTLVPNLNSALLNGQTAANTNTASTIVARDANGNFNAGTITAANLVSSHINQLTVNGDVAGSIVVLSGNTTRSHAFATAYNSVPACTLTPASSNAASSQYFVQISTTAFSVYLNSTTTADAAFTYMCKGNPN